MAYSKAKLKSNDDKASPCSKPFLIGNMSDKCLPTGKHFDWFYCFHENPCIWREMSGIEKSCLIIGLLTELINSEVCHPRCVFKLKGGVNFSQKHNYNMAKIMVFIAEQNYMFRPISAIFRFSQLLC